MIKTKNDYFDEVIKEFSKEMQMNAFEKKNLKKVLHKVFDENVTILSTAEAQVVKEGELTNDEVIVKFLEYKRMLGRLDSTIECYRNYITYFFEHKTVHFSKVNRDTIKEYLIWYESIGNNKKSANNARRILNVFFQYLEDENYILKNPCKSVPAIKEDRRIKRYYSDYEMEEMRDSCQTIRETAIVDLLLSTGIRVSEISGITYDDINWNERSIIIHGKGAADRYVFFSPRCEKHLNEYISNKPHETEYLFTSSRYPYSQLAPGTINRIVGTIGKRCGLPDISVHDFRRWFASDLAKKGVEETVIQDLMGHQSFSTTRSYYIKNNMDKAKYAHNTFAC